VHSISRGRIGKGAGGETVKGGVHTERRPLSNSNSGKGRPGMREIRGRPPYEGHNARVRTAKGGGKKAGIFRRKNLGEGEKKRLSSKEGRSLSGKTRKRIDPGRGEEKGVRGPRGLSHVGGKGYPS